PGAAGLVRSGPTDWFSHGADEAVRAALGLRQGEPARSPSGAAVLHDDVPPRPIDTTGEPLTTTVRRVLQVAAAGRSMTGVRAELTCPDQQTACIVLHGSAFDLGVAVERIRVAAWLDGLSVRADPVGSVSVRVCLDRSRDAGTT
ncbi:MAG: hypothetical protein CSB46_07410, partial [Micrococcales bacterium]